MNDRTHCPETQYATEKNHEIFEPIPFVLFPGGGSAKLFKLVIGRGSTERR